ncbi:EF-hand domain-containing protein [Sphingomonas koreensis]|uniref:EF-hand domain-containing protein n=1 Tax=Sphingomonas koreensis TaxID=93064 RepID=A0A430FXJ2_9SPHN|nr:EF-hand domain-containing protein [Sphingomonas koreensis]RSY76338.1 EF-hand domain-containing protein [Sphingomonas koreensis]
MTFLLVLAAALLAAQQQPAAPGVPLQPPQPGAEPIPLMIAEPVAMAIAAFDADGDGIVARAEFDTGVRRSFDAVAKGQASIGYIQFGDWSERWLGNRNALPSPFEVDQDGDNRISLGELQARFTLFFTRFDRDKNGSIARSELLTTRPVPQPGGRPGEKDDRRKRR